MFFNIFLIVVLENIFYKKMILEKIFLGNSRKNFFIWKNTFSIEDYPNSYKNYLKNLKITSVMFKLVYQILKIFQRK